MPIINVTLPSDATTADVADYNVPIQTMLAIINGQLDDANIASLSGTKIVAGSIPLSALAAAALNGWNTGSTVPNTIVYSGNGLYTLTYNGVDLTSSISTGMKRRFTRTVAAPTQKTLLGGTKYWQKATPNKFTFTNNFLIDVVVDLTNLTPGGTIVSCYNGTSGWALRILTDGRIVLIGYNGGAANWSQVVSPQTQIPNRPTRITAQLDMASFTATPTTSYIMIDGVDSNASVSRSGTNPVALVQAGNLNVGAENGGTSPLQGSVSQLAIFGAKITQATMRGYMGQGYVGNEASLLSAWSFNGVATDLNTTTPNDLTAVNAAGYTTGGAFGANGLSSTLEYGMTESISFAVNTTETVRVQPGSAIPVTGGVSASAYSTAEAPINYPNIASLNVSETSNPYKFLLGRLAALNCTTTVTPVQFDYKMFDTGNNCDVLTNKGRFTAPVSGYYQFYGAALASVTSGDHIYCGVMKNGSEAFRFVETNASATVNQTYGGTSPLMYLVAGDYVEFYWIDQIVRSFLPGIAPPYVWFGGHFVSAV